MRSEDLDPIVTVPNPEPGRPYTVEFRFPEFTAIYPTTSEPVFATVSIRYVPGEICLETVSLKGYLGSFRSVTMYYEGMVNRILDDLLAACSPREMDVTGQFTVRGGIESTVTARFEAGGGCD
jgi:7-cyano-7-deazaguanine reductase